MSVSTGSQASVHDALFSDYKPSSAFLFPCHGAQAVGMDKEAQNVPAAAILYKKANDILGFDLLDICINGLKEKLDSTVISQLLYFNAFVKVRLVSLFVSPTVKHVVVAVGNQITILSKEDDYQHPFSIFTSNMLQPWYI